jgi:hypothetical protein
MRLPERRGHSRTERGTYSPLVPSQPYLWKPQADDRALKLPELSDSRTSPHHRPTGIHISRMRGQFRAVCRQPGNYHLNSRLWVCTLIRDSLSRPLLSIRTFIQFKLVQSRHSISDPRLSDWRVSSAEQQTLSYPPQRALPPPLWQLRPACAGARERRCPM